MSANEVQRKIGDEDMDTEKTFQELNRAVDQFNEIVQLHRAAMRSIILAATVPGADGMLQAQILINERLKHGVGLDAVESAEDVLIARVRHQAPALLVFSREQRSRSTT
jgi:hypothetical protein